MRKVNGSKPNTPPLFGILALLLVILVLVLATPGGIQGVFSFFAPGNAQTHTPPTEGPSTPGEDTAGGNNPSPTEIPGSPQGEAPPVGNGETPLATEPPTPTPAPNGANPIDSTSPSPSPTDPAAATPSPNPGTTPAPTPAPSPNGAESSPSPSAAPSPSPTATPNGAANGNDVTEWAAIPLTSAPYRGSLELPISGATGFASIPLPLRAAANVDAAVLETLPAGTGFMIVREEGLWWYVQKGALSGWLPHRFSMVNLPDVIPSIIYDSTNTYSSKLRASGKEIPNLTGKALYSGSDFNARLGRDDFIMPALYATAKKIHAAQQLALADGNTLKIYEAFRPRAVQTAIVEALNALAAVDAEVMAGISTPPWTPNWFVATSVSNHQRGAAVDLSLARVLSFIEEDVGGYTFPLITKYNEYEMPTQIHELSIASAVFTQPVSSRSETDWKAAVFAPTMNQPAKALLGYMTSAGMTPLASEWWHFNDLAALLATREGASNGRYFVTELYSALPSSGGQ